MESCLEELKIPPSFFESRMTSRNTAIRHSTSAQCKGSDVVLSHRIECLMEDTPCRVDASSSEQADAARSRLVPYPFRPNGHGNGTMPVPLDEIASLEDSANGASEGQAASLYTAAPGRRRNHWVALVFGQCIALVAASMNATSYTLVQKYAVKTQLFQLFFIYLFLVSHLFFRRVNTMHPMSPVVSELSTVPVDDHGTREDFAESRVTSGNVEQTFHRSALDIVQHSPYHIPFLPRVRLRIPCILYFCFSLVDIIPNFMSLYSFRYSSLTSTTLLSSLTVPSTMLFSRCILRKVFACHHYMGVLFCVLGGTLTVYVDAFGHSDDTVPTLSNDTAPPTQSYIGDLLAIAAAILYGLGDCIAEYSVKNVDRNEYLGMLGLFGLLMTGLAMPLLEYEAIRDLFHTLTASAEAWQVLALLMWFVASVCLYYVTEARFLIASDATLLNLSMQSVSLWVFLFTLTSYDDNAPPPPTFFLALVLVGSGVFLYEMGFCQTLNEHMDRPTSTAHVEAVIQARAPVISYQTLAGTR